MKNIYSLFLVLITLTLTSYSQNFKEVSKEIGIDHIFVNSLMMGGGVAVLDYDNDGWLDLFMCGGLLNDKIYHNNGNGKFTDVSKQANLIDKKITKSLSMGAISGDYDNDGFEDILVTNYKGSSNTLYHNLGDGTFEDASNLVGLPINSNWDFCASFLDINMDGYLDMYIASISQNVQNVETFRHQLYINQKNGTYLNKAIEYGLQESGGYLGGMACTDVDMDNDLDLVLVNGMGQILTTNKVLINDYPTPYLTDKSTDYGMDVAMDGMGVGQVDIDEDGDFDYYSTEIGKNKFFRNDGLAKWPNIAPECGIQHGYNGTVRSTSWAPVFFDYDNDTYNDFALSCGFIGEPNTITTDSNKLWHNNGTNHFVDVTNLNSFGDPARTRGMVVADLNNDGAQDIIVLNTDTDAKSAIRSHVFMNTKLDGNNWFKLKLEGTKINRSAMGSRATVWAAGRRFLKEVEGGGGPSLSNHSRILHWGLGQYKKIDSLEVVWLGGAKQTYYNLPLNAQLNIKQDSKPEILATYYVSICNGELFEGNLYNQSQKIVKRAAWSSDVDTVTVINLKVLPKYNHSFNVGVCQGEPYLGEVYTKDTLIVKGYKTQLGCDSVVNYAIKVNLKNEIFTSQSYCDVANIEGKTYNSSRTLTLTNKNINGCDSITHLNVVINKSKVTSTSLELCSGEKYKDEIITSNKSFIENLKTTNGCDSTLTVDVKIKPNAQYFKDSTIWIGDSYDGVKYTEAKVLEIKNVIKNGGKNGCDSIFTVRLNVRDPQSVISENEFASLKVNSIGNKNYLVSYKLATNTNVELTVTNSSGNVVDNYLIGNREIGDYKFDFNASNLAKGAYFVILKTSESVLTQKLIIIE